MAFGRCLGLDEAFRVVPWSGGICALIEEIPESLSPSPPHTEERP